MVTAGSAWPMRCETTLMGTPAHIVDVGVTVADLLPSNTQPGRELVAQLGLVEDAGGLGMRVQLPRVQRPPHPVILRSGEIRDQDMGVQQRIIRPRGAVPERCRHEPVNLDRLRTARPATRVAGRTLQVADRGVHGGVVGSHHFGRGGPVTEGPQQRHRLRGPERVIEPRDRPCRMPGEPLAGRRVAGVEDGTQLRAGNFT